MKRRRIVRVLGTAFCGSSLLNQFLDTQSGIRGLGEVWNWFKDDTNAHCAGCRQRLVDCDRYLLRETPENFWEQFFEMYPDDHVLIDTSKHPSLLWQMQRMPPIPEHIDQYVLFLSKSPHEFVWSNAQHNPHQEYGYGLLLWMSCYHHGWRLADKGRAQDQDAQSWKLPKLKREHISTLTYRDMILDLPGQMKRLCKWLEVDFDREALYTKWNAPTDTCMVGGNTAVYAQKVNALPVFKGQGIFKDYLNGKYFGKQGEIFLDEQWRSDSQFLQTMGDYYDIRNEIFFRLDPLAKRLGYADGAKGFLDDLAAESGAGR